MNAKIKEEYRENFNQYNIPIQFSPQWMDAVCVKGDWNVVISKHKDGSWAGVLVYHYRQFLGMTFILMPPLTFYNGIYLIYPEYESDYKKSSFENKTVAFLVSHLPSYSFYYQQYHPDFTNWSSMLWKGFHQTSRYTYRLDTINKEPLEEVLKPSLKRNLKKSSENCEIKTVDILSFITELEKSYQTRPNPFSSSLISNVYQELSTTDSCHLYLCFNKETDEVLAGCMIAEDAMASYYVVGFYNPKFKNDHGISYLLWQIIINNKRAVFDFEGSIIPTIDSYFRSFGARQTPHHRIWKYNNPILFPLLKMKFKLPH